MQKDVDFLRFLKVLVVNDEKILIWHIVVSLHETTELKAILSSLRDVAIGLLICRLKRFNLIN